MTGFDTEKSYLLFSVFNMDDSFGNGIHFSLNSKPVFVGDPPDIHAAGFSIGADFNTNLPMGHEKSNDASGNH